MNLKLSSAIAAVCAVTFPAQADDPYVKLNYARTFSSAQITDSTDSIQAIADLDLSGGNLFGFAVGTDIPLSPRWGQFEWEGEFGYRNTSIDSVQVTGNVPGGFIDGADLDTIKTFALMGNVWWRPHLFGQIRPYAGGGVGAAYLPSGGLSADDIYSLAYQYGGGVDYEFGNGIRAGVGYRHFEISANDRDDSDPLFVFETDSKFSEDAVYASATFPLSIIGVGPARRSASSSQNQFAANQEEAQREAVEIREEAEKRARKQAEKEAKAQKKAEKQARKEAKKAAKSEKPGFLRRINPFGGDSDEKQALEQPASTPPALRNSSGNAFSKIETASVAPASSPSPSQKPQRATAPTKASLRTAAAANSKPAPSSDRQYKAGSYYAQLGAYSSESFARDMWRSKSNRQPEIFKSASYVIGQTSRRSDNKTLYLLRAGPYDKSGAKAICALAAGECIVVGD